MRQFKISELLSGLPAKITAGVAGLTVSDIVYDSRRARPDTVFVAIRGHGADGHDFIMDAYNRGARAFVVEETVDGKDATQFVVADTRLALAMMSARYFDNPSRRLSLAGVTGTNGKTTTAYMLDSIYRAAGNKSGLISTVEYRIAGRQHPVSRTTPESYDLQSLLSDMIEAGVGRAVMEVSSHAVTQKRVVATFFAVKVFTNISRDHLDYHGDMEEYYAAKRSFMLDDEAPAVVNIDDERGRELAGQTRDVSTYSLIGPAEFYAEGIKDGINGASFTIRTLEGKFPVELKLPGDFNVLNALAATAAARRQDVSWEAVIAGLGELTAVPGRFERLESGRGFSVIVDYAHTPDSLDQAIRTAKKLASGRVITIFGCGGDRDKGKRPEMGKTACELSDKVIITSDNPRGERPLDIIADIEAGAKGAYLVEPDRRRAIREAIAGAKKGDIVLIAGKGHENTQEFKDHVDEFIDLKVAKEEMTRAGADK